MKNSNAYLVFKTNIGDLTFELFTEKAPLAVQQLKKISDHQAFKGVTLFRIVPGVVIQFNDILHKSPALSSEELKNYRDIPLENKTGEFIKGSLALAHEPNNENSGHSSISIQLKNQDHLNGKFTLLGRVFESDDFLNEVQKIPLNGELPLYSVSVLETQFFNHETEFKKKYQKSLMKELVVVPIPQKTQIAVDSNVIEYNQWNGDFLMILILVSVTIADLFLRKNFMKWGRLFIAVGILSSALSLLLKIPHQNALNEVGMLKSTLSFLLILFSLWELGKFELPEVKK